MDSSIFPFSYSPATIGKSVKVVVQILNQSDAPYSIHYLRKLQALGVAAENDHQSSIVLRNERDFVTKFKEHFPEAWTGQITTVLSTPTALNSTCASYDVMRVFSTICTIDNLNSNMDDKITSLTAFATRKIENRKQNKHKYKRGERKSKAKDANKKKSNDSDSANHNNLFMNESEKAMFNATKSIESFINSTSNSEDARAVLTSLQRICKNDSKAQVRPKDLRKNDCELKLRQHYMSRLVLLNIIEKKSVEDTSIADNSGTRYKRSQYFLKNEHILAAINNYLLIGSKRKNQNKNGSVTENENPDTSGDFALAQQLQLQDMEILQQVDQSNQFNVPHKSDSFFNDSVLKQFQSNLISNLSTCEKHNISFANNMDCPLCTHDAKGLLFDTKNYSNDELEEFIDNLKTNKLNHHARISIDLTEAEENDNEQAPLPEYLNDDVSEQDTFSPQPNFNKKRRVTNSPIRDSLLLNIIELSSDSSSSSPQHIKTRNNINGNKTKKDQNKKNEKDNSSSLFDSMPPLENDQKDTGYNKNDKKMEIIKSKTSFLDDIISNNDEKHSDTNEPPAYVKQMGPNTTSQIPKFISRELRSSNLTHIILTGAQGDCVPICTLIFIDIKGLNPDNKYDTIESLRKAIEPLATENEEKIQSDSVFTGEDISEAQIVSNKFSFNNSFGDHYFHWFGQVCNFNPVVYTYRGGYLCESMYDSCVSTYKWNNNTPFFLSALQGRITDYYDLLLDDEMAYKFRSMKLSEKYHKKGVNVELKPLDYTTLKTLIAEKNQAEIENQKAAEQLSLELNGE